MGGAEPRRVGRPVTWAAPARLLHSSTPGRPAHVSVRAKKPAFYPLAKGLRTQKSGAPTSLPRTSVLYTVPTPLHSQTAPVFASVRTEH